jgi:hypothetical protein
MLKTISMMQPYLFPYLGYFQLIEASDAFVLVDDLQFVKGSWMNRNRVLTHDGQPKLITFPLRKGSRRAAINERWLSDTFDEEAKALLIMLEHSYKKAPYRAEVLALLTSIFANPDRNLARFTENSIRALCRYMKIDTPIHILSELADTRQMDKQDRIIKVAQQLGGTRYLNSIGGVPLYCPDYFASHDLQLRFIKMDEVTYPQLTSEFVPSLSIIDVLMFNSIDAVKELLTRYTLVEGIAHLDSSSTEAFLEHIA